MNLHCNYFTSISGCMCSRCGNYSRALKKKHVIYGYYIYYQPSQISSIFPDSLIQKLHWPQICVNNQLYFTYKRAINCTSVNQEGILSLKRDSKINNKHCPFYTVGAAKLKSKRTVYVCSLLLSNFIIGHSISSLLKITFTSIQSKSISNVNICK